jgi:hypothetical protein
MKLSPCFTTSSAVTAVATATAKWHSDIPLYSSTTQTCLATLLPALRCLVFEDYKKTLTSNHRQNKGPLSHASTYMGLRPMLVMWPKYINVSYLNMYFCTRVYICLPILQHLRVTSESHSYLQYSNSTFFLIYAYDYRQHTTSWSPTFSILIKTTKT